MGEMTVAGRAVLVRRGRKLEYFTIAWNALEGLVALGAGMVAGSVSLVGFGMDSFIEMSSGAALLWRMSVDTDTHQRESNERRALHIVGICFLLLAVYLIFESGRNLLFKQAPEHSLPGIILACASVIVMPILSRAKRKIGHGLGSAAMQADAKQADFCLYLSAILLVGLLMNAFFDLWWADPIGALLMVPLIAKEGVEALRGKNCADGHVERRDP